jgi:hypothetical protein
MNNTITLTDIPLFTRIQEGDVTKKELYERAVLNWNNINNNMPINIAGEYGCPVCYSKMHKDNRLVVENGYVVCDYCVVYVEEFI